MSKRLRLTEEFARKAPFVPTTKTFSDPTLPGFYLRVNGRSKSWIVQRRVAGRPKRVLLGHWPEMSADKAREEALKNLFELGQGRDPAEERRRALAQGMTLQDALDLHLASGRLAERTTETYRKMAENHLGDWLRRPLREIGGDRRAVRERHLRLTRKHGLRTADLTLAVLRAVYNRAMREQPDLPSNPTINVDWHGLRQRKIDLDEKKLKAWGEAVVAIPNPVLRDVNLFMALTGMRSGATKVVRAEHVDLKRGAIHVPKPKGGEKRAFDLPLSRPLVDLVQLRLRQNEALRKGTPWLFPSPTSKSGHMSELRHETLSGLHGHALRHLYRSLANEAGVPYAETKMLMGHKLPADATWIYLHAALDHLRGWQERASARILERLGLAWESGEWPPRSTEAP
jgi:integrase